jgi:hypothetical protein
MNEAQKVFIRDLEQNIKNNLGIGILDKSMKLMDAVNELADEFSKNNDAGKKGSLPADFATQLVHIIAYELALHCQPTTPNLTGVVSTSFGELLAVDYVHALRLLTDAHGFWKKLGDLPDVSEILDRLRKEGNDGLRRPPQGS